MIRLKSEARADREAFVKKCRQVCRCGWTFFEHGALPPHTHGDDCKGFEPAPSSTQRNSR